MRGRVCVCCTVFGIGSTLVSRSVLASSAVPVSLRSLPLSLDRLSLGDRLIAALSSIIAKDAGDRIPVWEATGRASVRPSASGACGDCGCSGAPLGAWHACKLAGLEKGRLRARSARRRSTSSRVGSGLCAVLGGRRLSAAKFRPTLTVLDGPTPSPTV